MTTSLLLSALMVGAPGPKAPPKQPAKLTGEWVRADLICKFDPDGKVLVRQPGQDWRLHSAYTLDRAADPARIDWDLDPDWPDGLKGIAKVEGDKLTICLGNGKPS